MSELFYDNSYSLTLLFSYGLYAPIRNQLGAGNDSSLFVKFIAGGSAGALASMIANPCDLMKVRLQVDGMKPGEIPRYSGMIDALRSIIRDEGFFGLWKGSGPTIGRATTLAAVEMSSYDEIKKQLIKNNIITPGTISGVFVSALASGFVSAIFSSPFDVVKSRVMGQRLGPDGRGLLYRGMVDCFVKVGSNHLSETI